MTQICPKKEIALKFQRNNLRIRISILKILCVYVCAQIALTFSDQISLEMDLGLEIQKTNLLSLTYSANFQTKRTTLTFSV